MKFIFLILLISSAFSATAPSRWRFEINHGTVETEYFEDNVTDKRVDQESSWTEFVMQYYIAPPYFDLTLSAQVTGASISEPTNEADQIQFATGILNIGYVLPQWSEFFQVKLNFERFFTTTETQNEQFGFRNLTGWQVYPELEWLTFGSDAFMQVNTFFKAPLWTDTANRREFTAGLKIRIPFFGGAQRFPVYAYKSAFIIKIFYSKFELETDDPDIVPVSWDYEQVGFSLGFNF